MARRKPKTPEQRRIAAAQAVIRRCHTDLEFRKKMIALWRTYMAEKAPSKRGKAKSREA